MSTITLKQALQDIDNIPLGVIPVIVDESFKYIRVVTQSEKDIIDEDPPETFEDTLYLIKEGDPSPQPMVLVFDVDAEDTIELPFGSGYSNIDGIFDVEPTVNVLVDWGDGSSLETITTKGNAAHQYSSAGEKSVKIHGSLSHFGWNEEVDRPISDDKLIKCTSFGTVGLVYLRRAFMDTAIVEAPTSLPDTILVLSHCFRGATYFNDGNICQWDTSNITDMDNMLRAPIFNQDIGSWDVSNVKTIASMFRDAAAFNQDISDWDISSVEDMSFLFYGTILFNQDITGWDTSSVKRMDYVFRDASAFDQNVSLWNFEALEVSVVNTPLRGFARSSGLSTENYSKLLIKWANMVYTNSAPYTADARDQYDMLYNSTNYGGTPYNNAVDARAFLVASPQSWTISYDALET